MNNKNNADIRHAIVQNFAIERYETYIMAARAIVHLYRDNDTMDHDHMNNLWHVFDLMSQDLQALKHRHAL